MSDREVRKAQKLVTSDAAASSSSRAITSQSPEPLATSTSASILPTPTLSQPLLPLPTTLSNYDSDDEIFVPSAMSTTDSEFYTLFPLGPDDARVTQYPGNVLPVLSHGDITVGVTQHLQRAFSR